MRTLSPDLVSILAVSQFNDSVWFINIYFEFEIKNINNVYNDTSFKTDELVQAIIANLLYDHFECQKRVIAFFL